MSANIRATLRRSRQFSAPAVLLLLVVLLRTAAAGEISGLPTHVLPTTAPDYVLYMGNDFLAVGTEDDYRTQQFNVGIGLKGRWVALLDHSTLTRVESDTGDGARIDLMSASLGYTLIEQRTAEKSNILSVGIGLRSVGNFSGSQIQNGFHALIESDTVELPYAATRQTDATVWLLGERHRVMRPASSDGFFSAWDIGYWARAGALATSDGQVDAVAGLYGVMSRPGYDIWLGYRHDWREGYSADRVQQETAREEGKPAVAYGLRFGSLSIEAVQRFDSSASYGRLSFISSAETRQRGVAETPRFDLQLGLYMPQMMFQLAGRLPLRLVTQANSAWAESMIIDVRAGQPQLGNDVERFIRTFQIAAGLEISRPVSDSVSWLRYYSAATLGWRSEQLIGSGELQGAKADAISRALLQIDAGLEFDATRLGPQLRHSLRIGLSGWAPFASATATVGGLPSQLQEPGLSFGASWNFSFQ